MQTGSLVETVGDFSETQRDWPIFTYPKKGDILVVSAVNPHANRECRFKGIILLSFEELPNTPGLCDKSVDGTDNFVELQAPVNIESMIEQDEYELVDQH